MESLPCRLCAAEVGPPYRRTPSQCGRFHRNNPEGLPERLSVFRVGAKAHDSQMRDRPHTMRERAPVNSFSVLAIKPAHRP